MGKYVAAGKGCVRVVDFVVNGELVTPDTVTYTLTDNTGTVVQSIEDIPLTDFDTSGSFAIPAAANSLGRVNEIRYLDVTFTVDSVDYFAQDFYQIRASIHFPLKPDDVRSLLGASPAELPDDQIDIFSAVQLVTDDLTEDVASVVESGSTDFPAVVQAVRYRAALLCADAIEVMLFASETADNTKYARFTTINFDNLRQRLLDGYNSQLLTVSGATEIDPVYGVVTQGTDPVTNS